MERYNDIRGIRLTPLISPQSVLSPAPPPITMSTSCPLGIAFAVRPSAVAFSSTQPFSSCTKPFARSTWPHAGSVKRAGIFCSSCWHESPAPKSRPNQRPYARRSGAFRSWPDGSRSVRWRQSPRCPTRPTVLSAVRRAGTSGCTCTQPAHGSGALVRPPSAPHRPVGCG